MKKTQSTRNALCIPPLPGPCGPFNPIGDLLRKLLGL